MSKVIVFGSLNMDLSIDCDRIPEAGETMSGGDFLTNPGGKGANQAVSAARLGADVSMIGAVGKDEFGEVLTGFLEGAEINCDHILHLDHVATGVAMIIRTDGQNRIILGPGANFAITAEEACAALEAIAEPGDIFLTQFENEPSVTDAVIRKARQSGLFTMLNPAPARPLDDTLWHNIDFLCVNETECQIITGIYPYTPQDASEAAQKIAKHGISQVVITMGSQGAFGLDDGEEIFMPSFKTNAIDTTGAGDTFIGAIIAGKSTGMSFEECLRFAAKASAIAVSRLGAMQAIPSRKEVDHFDPE